MEQFPNSISFERRTVLNIRGTRIIVNSHFDDTQDSLRDIIARLLKNDIAHLQSPEKYDIIAA